MILKRNYKTIIFTAFFAITIFFIHSISYAFESLVSSPESYNYDFEEVELNTTRTAMVSISNSSSSKEAVVLKTFAFQNGSYFKLIKDIPPDGIEVLYGETVGVEIAFTPTILSSVTDILFIGTGEESTPFNPNPHIAAVNLSGTGISKTDITINAILDFFDSSVASGSLIGNGGKMLESAGKLIESEDLDGACRQLTSISKKCDGKDRPPDFVLGAAESDPVPHLEKMIGTLSKSLDCE
jgi:hypothetical protein